MGDEGRLTGFGLELQLGGGLLGILALILFLCAAYHIIQSTRGFLAKLVWLAIVIFFPILGWLFWLLVGPRAGRN
ncbi:MAG: PLD nuclease N-terminal domain-containing protein [Alphaproteobacteria bacterium]